MSLTKTSDFYLNPIKYRDFAGLDVAGSVFGLTLCFSQDHRDYTCSKSNHFWLFFFWTMKGKRKKARRLFACSL